MKKIVVTVPLRAMDLLDLAPLQRAVAPSDAQRGEPVTKPKDEPK